MGMPVRVWFDQVTPGWVVRAANHGPAGAASLQLGRALLLVDAAEPNCFLELVLFSAEEGRDQTVAEPELELVRLLFGDELATLLQDARPEDEHVVVIDPPQGPKWEAASALAFAELMRETRSPRTPLCSLDSVLHALRLGHPEALALARDAAWGALPSLAAVEASSTRHPELFGSMSAPGRAEFLERSSAALEVLREQGLAHRSLVAERAVASLVDRLVALSPFADLDARRVSSATEATTENAPARVATRQVPDYQFLHRARETTATSGARGVPISWDADMSDVRVRMGRASQLLFDGARCSARGRVPGTVTVYLPLEPGADVEDLDGVSVRLLTSRGDRVASSETATRSPATELPQAIYRLNVPYLASPILQSIERDGVVVDIALEVLPELDAHSIAGLRRGRGRREGQRALAAAAAGRNDLAVGEWARAAESFDRAGDHELARQAADYLDRARSRPGAPDWVAEVLEAWAGVARAVLAQQPPERPELSALARELSAALDASRELAELDACLGRGDGAEEQADGLLQLERLGHLQHAVTALCILGDPASIDEARRLLRELSDAS